MLQRRCVLKRHMCNFVLHHVQRQFAPCLLVNFCNAKYAQCYVTFRQTPEICLKMLTAVAFWGIFYNYTILTMLSVSTTTTALCSSRHVCNFVLHHVQRQFAPCLLGNFCNAKYAQCYFPSNTWNLFENAYRSCVLGNILQLHYFDDVDCFNDCNGVCA